MRWLLRAWQVSGPSECCQAVIALSRSGGISTLKATKKPAGVLTNRIVPTSDRNCSRARSISPLSTGYCTRAALAANRPAISGALAGMIGSASGWVI
jgi:hypothetical protein